ncbi:type II and III secretion system protein family protein [Hellea balneolensis]|uniref:type II and III secretion system protein family protein n=1 Tax=Hellea balneolensis TaxID=287478 RepID=UPI0004161C1C|nr:type II and III secretion system protein family protein [Hellea balneolensis]
MSSKTLMTLALGTAVTFGLAASTIYTADAGTRSYSHIQSASAGNVNIQSPGQSSKSRSIVLPYSKSTVIELPQDMMDVIVSNPDIVESVIHTSHRAVLIGKQPGQTNAYFYGHDGQELLSLDIRVERDINGLTSLISQHVSDAQVDVQAVNNNILLTGSVQNASMANRVEKLAMMWLDENTAGGAEGEIVNLMSVEGKDQVLLKVRIVEMQRSVTKQMGINLNAIGQLGDSTVSLISNSALNTGAGLDGSFNWNNTGGGNLSSLGAGLQALERVGLIRTLAEPTLTAISGETANFLSGGEFPLLTGVFVDENGRLQREFEFKPYGVALGFTPVVLSEGRISLNISTEVSEPTTEGAFETGGLSSDILGLRIRRANTVVELPAGGSLVIAGLIREESRQSSDGIPGAKDIPGFGALFRNRDDLNTQTELVVMVTPYLVDPTHPDKLQTPLDGYVPASDLDNLLLGKMNKIYAANGKPKISADSLSGPFGHVVD